MIIMKASSRREKRIVNGDTVQSAIRIVISEMLIVIGGFFFSASAYNLLQTAGIEHDIIINAILLILGLTALIGVAIYTAIIKRK